MDALTRRYLALALTPGLGPRKIKLLTEHFGDAEAVYRAPEAELLEVEGIGPKLARSIIEARDSDKAEKEIARAAKVGAEILPLVSPEYPDILRQIYDPPPVLYLRGELPQSLMGQPEGVRSIAIVGTRNASTYALHLSYELAKDLAAAGVTVVSGLAKGVDGEAHRGAISITEGQTVAVLGSGVDTIYPRESLRLSREILAGHGAILSEYPVGTEPRAEHFPARNRIVNGLARGVVVVEGSYKSGSMITAGFALDEGRTVFAVPGRVGDPRAKGTLDLLKGGGVLTQSARDILDEMGWTGSAAETPAPSLEESELKLLYHLRK